MQIKTGLILVVTLAMIGCSTGKSGESVLGKPGSEAWFSTSSVQTQISYFTEICQKYGFLPATNELAQCVQKETNDAKTRVQTNIQTRALRRQNSTTSSINNSDNEDVKRRIRNLEWDSQMKEVNSNLDKLMRR